MDIPQDFGSLFFLAFCGVMTVLLTTICGIIGFVAYSVREDFKEMGRSVHDLDVSLAKNLASHDARLESHDDRLEKLERVSHD